MCEISPLWSLNTLSNCLIEDMQSHISCICVIFSEVCFHMCSQTCLNRCKVTFVACVRFTQMLYYTSPLKSPAWTVTIVADVRNFSIMISKRLLKLPDWRYTIIQCHISCMCVIFLNVYFHMCSQFAFLNRCKVTIVACERFVNFHMSPQMAYLTRCKFTFVACVCFSQMWVCTFALKSPSIATIVACERFF